MTLFSILVMGGFAVLRAGTIDISTAESITVRTGESITFDLLTRSYGVSAGPLGVPSIPSALQFALVTSLTASQSRFAATLSSLDASTVVTLELPVSFTAGNYSSAGFQGAVSSLQSQFRLSPDSAQDLFAGGVVRLTLFNLGGAHTFGLNPLPLSQDLYASLSEGGLSVGARTASVNLNTPSEATAPEPGTGWLTGSLGLLLCAISGLISRSTGTRR